MPHRDKLSAERIDECQRVRALYLAEKARSKITHKILGDMIGKSDKTIGAIVTNRMRVSLEVGQALAKVFGVPLDEILPWTASLTTAGGNLADVIQDLQDLSDENREHARRLVRSLLDSQE